MARRQNRWAVSARRRLVLELGGRCEFCGSTTISDLEIDHKYGRTWTPREVSSSHRVSRYRSEARRGLLRVLCKSCNSRDGSYRYWSLENYPDFMANGGRAGLEAMREFFERKERDAEEQGEGRGPAALSPN